MTGSTVLEGWSQAESPAIYNRWQLATTCASGYPNLAMLYT